MSRPLALVAVAALAACALAACGPRWAEKIEDPQRHARDAAWKGDDPSAPPPPPELLPALPAPPEASGPRPQLQLDGGDSFRNTYYDFPRDKGGDRSATIYDAACAPIAQVSQAFHDQVCVQGSGRLTSGETVSFAKRGCACAAVCPRTGQKICFEKLDPQSFPHGRGAAGRPITPLRTIAVDVSIIPLGSAVFIPEFVGLPLPQGGTHDGCFRAEDRGLKVVGKHIDVFTGDPATTTQWNQLVPSNRGVRVHLDDPRCSRR
jgi:3D (Asp-Asp-Asp) domain-containing protein